MKDKVIVIAGGAGLIGRSLVADFTANQAKVIVASRDAENSFNVDSSTTPMTINTDVTSPSSVEAMIKQVHATYGRVDAVVNCAFPRNENYGRKFEDVTFDDFTENVSDHLGSCFLLCQKFIAYFKKQGGGNIINLSSVYGLMAPRFDIYEKTAMTKEVEYSVSKAGVLHLTKYLARYLKGADIRINCVSPGGVIDDQDPQFIERYNSYCLNKGMLDADDIVGSIRFLISEDSRFINGQNLVIDDGFSL